MPSGLHNFDIEDARSPTVVDGPPPKGTSPLPGATTPVANQPPVDFDHPRLAVLGVTRVMATCCAVLGAIAAIFFYANSYAAGTEVEMTLPTQVWSPRCERRHPAPSFPASAR